MIRPHARSNAGWLRGRLQEHLTELVEVVGPRPAGSPANRRATDYLRGVLTGAGLVVTETPFTTRWWEPEPSVLEHSGGASVELLANPFSRPGEVRGAIVKFESRQALLQHHGRLDGAIVVLGPALGGEPVMPKSFPFFMPESHRELIEALEALQPGAVVAASNRHMSLPTFEDPDLCFPSLTVAPKLAGALRPGEQAQISFRGRIHPGRGVTVSTRTGDEPRRLVISAHVDTKVTTPGAFDNAASVAVLLALAETNTNDVGPLEFVFFNGEDHYDACGEQAWLAVTDLDEIAANVNLDGAGVAGRRTGVTCLACPPAVEDRVGRCAVQSGWTRMEPWFESDHAIFAMRDIPAVAITSEGVHDLFISLAHTPADTIDRVDVDVLVEIAKGLGQLLPALSRTLLPATPGG